MFAFFKKLFGFGNNNELILNAIAEGALLVDVRTKEEFTHGSVPGAINIPLNNITSNLEKFKNQTGIIVFCASGNRSRTAKMILEENRIKNVINSGSWKDVNALM